MKKSRVLVVLHPSLMPPRTLEGQDPKAIEEWRTEFDVISTLRAGVGPVRLTAPLIDFSFKQNSIAAT